MSALVPDPKAQLPDKGRFKQWQKEYAEILTRESLERPAPALLLGNSSSRRKKAYELHMKNLESRGKWRSYIMNHWYDPSKAHAPATVGERYARLVKGRDGSFGSWQLALGYLADRWGKAQQVRYGYSATRKEDLENGLHKWPL